MCVPFAILVLALIHFVSAQAHATSDFTYVTSPAAGKQCYTRYGIAETKNYCDGTAAIPKVVHPGPFSDCVVETAMQLLDEGTRNAIQFRGDGTVQVIAPKPLPGQTKNKSPITVTSTQDGPAHTYLITIGDKSKDTAQNLVKVVVNGDGKIVTASSTLKSRDPDTNKMGTTPDFKTIINYDYVKDADGKDKCIITRIDAQKLSEEKIRVYSRWICNDIADSLKQHHNMTDADRDALILGKFNKYASDVNAKDTDAKFMYGASANTVPDEFGATSIPEMLMACKLSGATGNAPATTTAGGPAATGAVKKAASAKAKASDD